MNSVLKKKPLPYVIAMTSAALLTAQAQASVLEEVVVTAQKREQSLQDVGIAVSAFSGDQLDALGISSAAEITELIPNIQMQAANGNGNHIVVIRGIGLNDFSLNNTPTAAIHIDEGYLASGAMTGFSLFDIERVEVLKGPQGTLYGRNSTAGVVNFITRKPSQEFDAFIETTIGNWKTLNVEGAVGGGLTDTLSGRLAFRSDRRGEGFQDNLNTAAGVPSKIGEVDKWGLRAQLLWEPSDELSVLFNLHGSKDQSDNWVPTNESVDDGAGGICSAALSGPTQSCFDP